MQFVILSPSMRNRLDSTRSAGVIMVVWKTADLPSLLEKLAGRAEGNGVSRADTVGPEGAYKIPSAKPKAFWNLRK